MNDALKRRVYGKSQYVEMMAEAAIERGQMVYVAHQRVIKKKAGPFVVITPVKYAKAASVAPMIWYDEA